MVIFLLIFQINPRYFEQIKKINKKEVQPYFRDLEMSHLAHLSQALVLGTQKNILTETFLSTHNICFGGEIHF